MEMFGAMDHGRRLHDQGFEGWDISAGTYGTSYVVMFVGILCAMLMWRQFGQPADGQEQLPSTFATFSLLAGLSFGFAGIAVHVLATMSDEGHLMSRIWFTDDSMWLVPWTFAMALGPLASACALSIGFAYSGLSAAFIRATKIVGLIFAIWEVFLCFYHVDASGTASVYWGLAAAIGGHLAIFIKGCGDTQTRSALALCAMGYSVQTIGYLLLIISPLVCHTHVHATVVHTETGPLYVKAHVHSTCFLYPDSFNQNAIFHVCYALSILILYCGVSTKSSYDRELSYLALIRDAYANEKDQPRCCGF